MLWTDVVQSVAPSITTVITVGALDAIAALADIAVDMRADAALDVLLQRVVDRAAALVGSERTSLRLLGDCGSLLATCRHGAPIHTEPSRFRPGEGLIGHVAATGQPLRLDDAETHPAFVTRPGQVHHIGAWLGVPLMDEGHVIGVLAAVDAVPGRFDARAQQLLEIVAALCAPRIALARLAKLARVDALTLTLNRHGLRAVIEHHESSSDSLAVMLIDLDRFKDINDAHGHTAGDEVLVAFSSAMSRAVRREDEVCRYGGDEFVILLPGAPIEDALRVAARVQEAARGIATPTGTGPLTASIGVATRLPGEPLDSAIARADGALYAAKEGGRDRIVAAPAPT